MILDYLKTHTDCYTIKHITEDEYGELYLLQKSNPQYYSYLQDHEVTLEESIEDTKSLPPNKGYDSKFYIGFYRDDKLEVVMDYIEGYPSEDVAWVGLLMIYGPLKGKGLGRQVMDGFFKAAKESGFKSIQLGVIDINQRAMEFWSSLGFEEIRRSTIEHENGSDIMIIVMNKSIEV